MSRVAACPRCGVVRQVHGGRTDRLCQGCIEAARQLWSDDVLRGGQWVPDRGILRWRPQ